MEEVDILRHASVMYVEHDVGLTVVPATQKKGIRAWSAETKGVAICRD